MTLHPQLDQLVAALLPSVKQFHAAGQMAPHGASMNGAGDIQGALLVNQDDRSVGVVEAIAHFESKFRRAADANEIVASAIFFHGIGAAELARPAQTREEARAIVALLEHRRGDSVFLVVRYTRTAHRIDYELGRLVPKPATVFVAS